MGTWWRRTTAMLGLLTAIVSDLRRRAWWAYRHGSSDGFRPVVAMTARRRVETSVYLPMLTPSWQAVAARALPIIEADIIDEDDTARPTIVVDVAERPDVYDMPRVLRYEQSTRAGRAVVATQWLADLDHDRVLLVVTFVEPVASTWAISFDVPRTLAVLEQIATTADVSVIWVRPEPHDAPAPGPTSEGIHLTVTRTAQLRAILGAWAERHRA